MSPSARLALVPDSPRGWFCGRALLAEGPAEESRGLTLAEAGEALEEAFTGAAPGVAVAVVPYEGAATVVRFARPAVAHEPTAAADPGGALLHDATSDLDGPGYRAAVADAKERIAAGDVYVLNLTVRCSGRLPIAPADAFDALRARAGSAMSALLELADGSAIASVSPERFLRVRDEGGGRRTVEVCPIKGTRPRGSSPDSDAASAAALLRDPKERAEHVMVVDLERNDLGRVCLAGSVVVDPLYQVVPTPYCHQLVSRVAGELSPQAGIAGLLAATFPCGSVTGAPKLAAIRIAGGLERSPRGAYCGALMVAMRGEIDSSVLIRTLECDPPGDDGTRSARWGAGCGITHDSDPAAEWEEVVLKAWPALGGPDVPTHAPSRPRATLL